MEIIGYIRNHNHLLIQPIVCELIDQSVNINSLKNADYLLSEENLDSNIWDFDPRNDRVLQFILRTCHDHNLRRLSRFIFTHATQEFSNTIIYYMTLDDYSNVWSSILEKNLFKSEHLFRYFAPNPPLVWSHNRESQNIMRLFFEYGMKMQIKLFQNHHNNRDIQIINYHMEFQGTTTDNTTFPLLLSLDELYVCALNGAINDENDMSLIEFIVLRYSLQKKDDYIDQLRKAVRIDPYSLAMCILEYYVNAPLGNYLIKRSKIMNLLEELDPDYLEKFVNIMISLLHDSTLELIPKKKLQAYDFSSDSSRYLVRSLDNLINFLEDEAKWSIEGRAIIQEEEDDREGTETLSSLVSLIIEFINYGAKINDVPEDLVKRLQNQEERYGDLLEDLMVYF